MNRHLHYIFGWLGGTVCLMAARDIGAWAVWPVAIVFGLANGAMAARAE